MLKDFLKYFSLILITTFLVLNISINLAYKDKILPNVFIAGINVGGLTTSEALEKLKILSPKNKNITLSSQTKEYLFNSNYFKPFVYTVANRDKGFSPCFKVPNQLVTFEKEDKRWKLISNWTPHNSNGKYGGMLTLKQALANSVNTVTAYLMHEMTPEAIITLVKDMGIQSEIPPTPSICLGSADISLLEMLGAYSTFADKGLSSKPIFITRIEDKSGNILQEFSPEKKEVLDEQTAYVMIELMRGVISQGTGKKLRYKYDLNTDIVGKTGTTQNQSDAWFMGLTPDLIAGVWCGCDDRFVRFRSITYGQGAVLALPVWAKFFQKVYADKSLDIDLLKKFTPPENMNVVLDCSQYVQESNTTSNSPYGNEFDRPTSTEPAHP